MVIPWDVLMTTPALQLQPLICAKSRTAPINELDVRLAGHATICFTEPHHTP